jgi:hypothetical protein
MHYFAKQSEHICELLQSILPHDKGMHEWPLSEWLQKKKVIGTRCSGLLERISASKFEVLGRALGKQVTSVLMAEKSVLLKP